ncbi:hypothetical protein lerEdw1_011255 [Lerista edwardsae]|nr:hypothetical protein lerEdw1_011255 [Lerista edwardsae]
MPPKGRKRKAAASTPPAKATTSSGMETSGADSSLKRPKKSEGSGPHVIIEHCADTISQALHQAFSDIVLQINPEKPRRNSFEVVLLKEDGTKVELWSGLKKGPPRKLKFPEPNKVVEMLKGNLE